jgi:hypothetical protein
MRNVDMFTIISISVYYIKDEKMRFKKKKKKNQSILYEKLTFHLKYIYIQFDICII